MDNTFSYSSIFSYENYGDFFSSSSVVKGRWKDYPEYPNILMANDVNKIEQSIVEVAGVAVSARDNAIKAN